MIIGCHLKILKKLFQGSLMLPATPTTTMKLSLKISDIKLSYRCIQIKPILATIELCRYDGYSISLSYLYYFLFAEAIQVSAHTIAKLCATLMVALYQF